MNRTSSTLFVLAACCSCTASASVEVVFQRSLTIDRSVNIFKSSHFDLDFVFADSFFTPTNSISLFDGLEISPVDVGRTFDVNAGNDPRFAAVVERLTDSQNQYVRLNLTERASGRSEQRGFNERGFFLGKATVDSPDLAGSEIDSIGLSIDEFTLTPPATPGAAAASLAALPVQLVMTFTVLGNVASDVVPEPAAALVWASLATLALTACAFARRWLSSVGHPTGRPSPRSRGLRFSRFIAWRWGGPYT